MTTILIVDDRPLNREVLSMFLDEQGYQILEAGNGVEALKIARANKIDLIITDIVMPEMDGIMLAQALQEDPILAIIPIIFYSATYKAIENYRLTNLSTAKYILTKPCEPQIILNTIKEALSYNESNAIEEKKYESVERVGKREKLENINFRLTSLIEIGLDMSLEHDIERLSYITCRGGRQLLDACYSGIIVQSLTSSKQYKIFNVGRDNSVTSNLFELKNLTGILKEVFLEEKPVCIHSPIIDLDKIGLHGVTLPISSFLGIPLKTPRRCYGQMYFIHKIDHKFFSASDQKFMITLADKFAINYENLIFHDEIEQQTKKLKEEIIQRKQSDKAFRQSDKKFRQLAENIQDFFWITNNDLTQFIYISPLYEKIWGRSIEMLYRNSNEWMEAVVPEDRQFVLDSFQKFQDGKNKIDIEYKILRPDGSIRWIHNRGFQVFDENGKFYRIAGIAVDVTERKELKELAFRHKYHLELAELSRVNSMGEMASTLAHELNQPLTAILTYSQICIRKLQDQKSPNTEILEVMNLVVQQTERAGAIIHGMKNFVRKGNLFLENLDINAILSNIFPLIQYEGRNTATVMALQLAEPLPLVYVDKLQIEQVVLNLARNAIEAMEEGNTLNPQLKIQTKLAPNNTVTVSIFDNGPGFPKEIAENLFSPYITTKPTGTGMGLAISRTIIEAHGGQLSANRYSNTTCFSFTLPAKSF